jgi:histidine ammonia-lyase
LIDRIKDAKAHSATDEPLVLDGARLTCAQLVDAALGKRPVTLATGADDRIRQGRTVVAEFVRSGVKGYGVTTGVGSQKEFAVPPEGMRDCMRSNAHPTTRSTTGCARSPA